MRSRFTRILTAVSIAALIGAVPASVVQADTPVTSPRLTELESESMVNRAEAEQIGGHASPERSLNSVETRIGQIEQNIERLSNVLHQIGANRADLDRLRREYGDTDIVELKDVAQEGGEQVAEQCVTRACTKYGAARAAPYVGWIMLAGDVVEYGGKFLIREVNEARLRELVRNESAKHSEIFELVMAQYCELGEERAKARRLRELRERENVLFREIAQERQRLKERSGRATRHAVRQPDTDPAGDAEEHRRYLDEAVRPSQPSSAPQRPRNSVRLADPTQGAMNLSPFAREVLAAHNGQRAQYGYPALRWNPALESTATAYAHQLASTGQRVHAPRAGRGIERENLSQGMLGWNTGQLMASWIKEQQHFTPGTFPNVCSGDWSKCGHYTQMIWPSTTDIGCGSARGSGFSWLVCRYSPGGNKDGQPVGQRMAMARRAC